MRLPCTVASWAGIGLMNQEQMNTSFPCLYMAVKLEQELYPGMSMISRLSPKTKAELRSRVMTKYCTSTQDITGFYPKMMPYCIPMWTQQHLPGNKTSEST